YTSPKPLFVNNILVPQATAIANPSGDNTFAGAVTMTGSTTMAVTAGSLTLTNDVSGGAATNLTKSGTGLLSLKSVRTDSVTINAGTMKVLPIGAAVSGVSSARTLSISA